MCSSRPSRRGPTARPIQLWLSLLALAAAFGFIVWNAVQGTDQLVAQGAVAIDPPALFLQGTIVLLSFAAVLLMAERSLDPAGDAFSPMPAAAPAAPRSRPRWPPGWVRTEIFPLTLFAVGGMMLFPASNDLLTLFVALEVFSLPLYLMCGLARRRRLLSQEAALKYFLLGAVLVGVLPLRRRLRLRLLRVARARRHLRRRSATTVGRDPLLLVGIALVAVGVLFKVGAVPVPRLDP